MNINMSLVNNGDRFYLKICITACHSIIDHGKNHKSKWKYISEPIHRHFWFEWKHIKWKLTVIVQKYVACWWWFHFDNHHYRNWSRICKIYEIKVGISIGVIDSNLSQFQVDDIGNLKSSYIKEKNRKNMSL